VGVTIQAIVLLERLPDSRAQVLSLGGVVVAVALVIFLASCGDGGDGGDGGNAVRGTGPCRGVVPAPVIPTETATPEVADTFTPSSEADPASLDAERLRELPLLQAALVEYCDRFGEYPSTNGQTQTLCVFEGLDAGCGLKEVLDDDEEGILEDPSQEREKGYWYASDGLTYTIWMLHEGPDNPGDPTCPDVNPHLKDAGPLFCVTVVAPAPTPS